MRKFSYNDSLKSFILLTVFLTTLILLAFLLVIASRYSGIVRDILMFSLLLLTAFILLFLLAGLLSSLALYFNFYKNSKFTNIIKELSRAYMNYIVFISKNKNILRFYIKINNIIVKSENKKYPSESILILLPHCLQNSDCMYKVTNSISNCARCNKCNISEAIKIAEKHNIHLIEVATGGTVARNIVKKFEPKIIIAVACERDLALGIADIKNIPVIGLLNIRPNGPCHNTTVNINQLEKTIKSIIS